MNTHSGKSRIRRIRGLLAGLALLFALNAGAHQPSESYLVLTLQSGTLTGHLDLSLTDLELAIGLDGNRDRAITWGELRSRRDAIAGYALTHLAVQTGGHRCDLDAGELTVADYQTGSMARLAITGQCQSAAQPISIDYRLMFDVDRSHQGIVRLSSDGGDQLAILNAEAHEHRFTREQSTAERLILFLRLGAGHILEGPDHLLFLGTLLLALPLVRRGRRWTGRDRGIATAWSATRLVTLFTVAHSLTLLLATTGRIPATGGWIEPAIAASIVLVALNNMLPVVSHGRGTVIFLFGLIHGLGFAGGLADISPDGRIDIAALAGFNIGIEVVQLGLSALALPCLFWLASMDTYRRWLMPVASAAIALLATAWLWQRLA